MQNFHVTGGKKLSGTITVNSSKNAAVALLAASVMNHGTTILKNVPQIEEVNRWIELLESIGVKVTRGEGKNQRTLTIKPSGKLKLSQMDKKSAKKTRSAILLLGALSRDYKSFSIPQAGGCRLGARSVQPHIDALKTYGLEIAATAHAFTVTRSNPLKSPGRFALGESGDTVTENAIITAAQVKGVTEIRFASANYMVQDLCYFLVKCGVRIDDIGSTTLRVHGVGKIKKDVTYEISEDPIEAMFFIALAISTNSELTIERCPYDFIELELTKLKAMGLMVDISPFYKARNKKTTLVDLKIFKSKLAALPDKIEERPFPGINMDNLPFFAVIATQAKGKTLLHDWAYETRPVYFAELSRLGARVRLLDQHRIQITGPTKLKPTSMSCPPALRPGAVLLVAMLAAPGESVLRNVYMINRGYENLAQRLQALGALIEMS